MSNKYSNYIIGCVNQIEKLTNYRQVFKVYIELLRPFTLIYPAVAVFSGALIALKNIPPAPLLNKVILGSFAASILNGASNVLNQYYDIHIDAINKPFRPLPSNKITLNTAMSYAILLYTGGLLISYVVQIRFLIIVLIAVCFTIFYSVPPLRTKNRAMLGNFTLALPRGLLPLVAGWAIILPVTFSDPWALGIVLGIFVFGANSTKDFADIEGDKRYGAITLPVKYGVKIAVKIIAPFLIAPFLLIIIFVSFGWISVKALPLALLSFWGGYAAFLILNDPQRVALEKNHPAWIHMYLMMLTYVIGAVIAYLIK